MDKKYTFVGNAEDLIEDIEEHMCAECGGFGRLLIRSVYQEEPAEFYSCPEGCDNGYVTK